VSAETLLGRQQLEHLFEEERVSVGDALQVREQIVGEHHARPLAGKCAQLAGSEPGERNGARLARDVGEQGAYVAGAPHLALAIGAEHQDRGAAKRARQEAEQQQGVPVGGVQVVEHQHGGADGRHPRARCPFTAPKRRNRACSESPRNLAAAVRRQLRQRVGEVGGGRRRRLQRGTLSARPQARRICTHGQYGGVLSPSQTDPRNAAVRRRRRGTRSPPPAPSCRCRPRRAGGTGDRDPAAPRRGRR
jgi:hypothetical protein